jgi:hypothetical protein
MTPPALRSWRSIILDDWRDDLRVVPKYVAQNMGAGQSPPQIPLQLAVTMPPSCGTAFSYLFGNWLDVPDIFCAV